MKHLLFSVTIRDCEVQTFTVGGNGGSGKDTSNTGVRVVHAPSSATGTCRDHRSQFRNKQEAFLRMARSERFQLWARRRAAALMGLTAQVEAAVEEAMRTENLKVEVQGPQGWVRE